SSLCGMVLIYPALDPTMSSASYREYATGPFMTADRMKWFWNQFLSRPEDHDAVVRLLTASNLRAFPTSLIMCAEHDVLRDEAEAFALRLDSGTGYVVCERVPGTVHGYLAIAPMAAPSRTTTSAVIK